MLPFFILRSVCRCGKGRVGNDPPAGTGLWALLTAEDEQLEGEVRPGRFRQRSSSSALRSHCNIPEMTVVFGSETEVGDNTHARMHARLVPRSAEFNCSVHSFSASLPPVVWKEVRSDQHDSAETSMTSPADISHRLLQSVILGPRTEFLNLKWLR